MPNFSSLAGLEVPEKFVVGWWGGGVGWGGVVGWWVGLFDYSVYSRPSFNQEWNQAMVGPG